ncbi:MAG: hypothetical protein K0S39_5747 [Paenibacillus sp.]|nr:hypothetical protein [Paenibacillus sp.]
MPKHQRQTEDIISLLFPTQQVTPAAVPIPPAPHVAPTAPSVPPSHHVTPTAHDYDPATDLFAPTQHMLWVIPDVWKLGPKPPEWASMETWQKWASGQPWNNNPGHNQPTWNPHFAHYYEYPIPWYCAYYPTATGQFLFYNYW